MGKALCSSLQLYYSGGARSKMEEVLGAPHSFLPAPSLFVEDGCGTLHDQFLANGGGTCM